ncbi:MAG: hypothetical protein AAF493_26025 [Pseudomonadota bacterium]
MMKRIAGSLVCGALSLLITSSAMGTTLENDPQVKTFISEMVKKHKFTRDELAAIFLLTPRIQ